MDKRDIVRNLKIANQLWAIEGANPYSVKAHERSAEAILQSPLSIAEILALPPSSIYGVGPETLAMVRTLQDGGMNALLERLHITIPIEAAELTRLPGIGPKTAHTLIHQHGVHSAEHLQRALDSGQLKDVPGLGKNRLARLHRELRVFLERKHNFPIAVTWPVASHLAELIRQVPGVHDASVTGALRRLAVMSPVIDLVAASDDPSQVFQWAVSHFGESAAAAQSASASSHVIESMVQADFDQIPIRISITPTSHYPLLLMQTTGGETHQQVMEGILRQNGIEWTSTGLVQADGTPVSIQHEANIYTLAGLPVLPPELREGKGMLCNPAKLVARSDIHGDLHVHTTWSDGQMSIAEVVHMAEALGYEYIAITDHSQSLTIANGLTPERLQAQHAEIESIRQQTNIKILHGIEVDILPDGRLDLSDEVLFQLDLVIASIHSSMQQSEAQMTQRILSAIRHPAVHIIGHLTGRKLGRRSACEMDFDRLLEEAVAQGVMFELNANPNRLDISESLLRKAKSSGMMIPIDTDTHHREEFEYMAYGIRMAHRGWLYKDDVLNTLSYDALMQKLRRNLT